MRVNRSDMSTFSSFRNTGRGSAIFLVLLQKHTTLAIANVIGANAALTVFNAVEVGGAYDVLPET